MSNSILVNGALGLLPVLSFLGMLTQLDSFKLVRRGFVGTLIAIGAVAAIAAYFIGKALVAHSGVSHDELTLFLGPTLEESIKALAIVVLIRINRIGFFLDAVIAGFAIGAGFALLENYLYLQVIGNSQAAAWVVRGFGTAIMHGGATAIFAVIAQKLTPQDKAGSALRFLPALAAAIALHAAFNQFLDYPVFSTLAMVLGLAAALGFISLKDRQSIDNLLDVEFDDYRKLLLELRSGAIGEDGALRFLEQLRVRFDPAETEEISQYVELHAELVLFAEEVLKAQGRGERIDVPEGIKEKLAHFHYLEERIGRAVRMVLRRHLKFSRYQFFQLYKLQRDAGGIAEKAHVFNSDLLLNEPDQAEARRAFPRIFYALDDPALRDCFAPFDCRANLSKARSRRWGVVSVLLIAAALFIAGAELNYRSLPLVYERLISGFGAFAGVAGVTVGAFGLIFRGKKRRWLADRLATERLRQFHFQHYVMHAGEIIAGAASPAAASAYLERRAIARAAFEKEFLLHVDERIHALVHQEDCGDGAIFSGEPSVPDEQSALVAEYFAAYAKLRFDMQLNYCNHVLRESKGFRNRSATRQAEMLGGVTLAGVFGLLAFYAAVFAGPFAGFDDGRLNSFHVAAIWAAIAALAARTFEEGLQPRREIERMRQYRIQLRRTHERYRAAETPAEKISIMQDLEKLTHQEMALFLKSSYEAQFVM